MSYPLVPPPANDAGAFTVPRQLQRWLDVNPATKLTRTQAYITLPSFSVAQTWNGYSDIIATFNYEGPNNFVLTGFAIEPSPAPNYCLCVSWRVGGVNYRYSLWRGVGEVFYFNVPVYNGQKIAKNFRFEIWSTSSTPSAQSTSINIYTSVLGGIDYRWGGDFVLVNNDAIVTSFSDSATVPAVPAGILAQFEGSYGVNGVDWLAAISNTPAVNKYINTAVTIATPDIVIANKQSINGLAQLAYYTQGSGAFDIAPVLAVLVKLNAFDNGAGVLALYDVASPSVDFAIRISSFGDGQTSGKLQVYTSGAGAIGSNSPTINAGAWMVLILTAVPSTNSLLGGYVAFNQTEAIPAWPGYTLGAASGVTVSANLNTLGSSSSLIAANATYAEVLLYPFSNGIEQSIINYLFMKYRNTFNLPLTFPANSTSTTN